MRKRDGKSEVKVLEEELKEESLTREFQSHNGILPIYKIKDGEFENFPEIHAKTIEKLQQKGIVSLFPVQ